MTRRTTTTQSPGTDPVLARIAALAAERDKRKAEYVEARIRCEAEMVRVTTLPESDPEYRKQNVVAYAAGSTKAWMNKLFKQATQGVRKATPPRKAASKRVAAGRKTASAKR